MRITRGAGGIGTDFFLVSMANGQAFSFGLNVAAVAAQNSEALLFNPAASGKTVRVRSVIAAVSAQASVVLGAVTVDPGSPSNFGVNLKLGGAASLAKFETQTTAAALASPFLRFSMPAETSTLLMPGWVAEVPAGNGLVVHCDTANVTLRASITWIEV